MSKNIILTICGAIIFSLSSSYIQCAQEHSVDFVYERDINDVLKIIQDDWHWLFTSKNPTYDAEYIMQYFIPNPKLLEKKDVLKMKVLRNEECVLGFITFCKKDAEVGRIVLLSIAQRACGMGFDRTLIVTAINDLFREGCTSIYLFTHKKNEKVCTYESLGFQEDALPQEAISWWEENHIPAEEYAQYARYSVNKQTFKP